MKFEAVVLIADGVPDRDGEYILRDGVQLNNPLVIIENNDPTQVVGTGTAEWSGNSLIVKFDTNDELLIPAVLGYLRPSIYGQTINRHPRNMKCLARTHISHISLGVSLNADDRIPCLPFEQLGTTPQLEDRMKSELPALTKQPKTIRKYDTAICESENALVAEEKAQVCDGSADQCSV